AIKRISWIVERQPARKHGGGSRWPAELEKLCVAGSIPAGRSNLRHEVCGSGAVHRAIDGQNPLSFALNALVSTRTKSRVSEAHRRWHRLNPSNRDADESKKLKFCKRRLPMNEMLSTNQLGEIKMKTGDASTSQTADICTSVARHIQQAAAMRLGEMRYDESASKLAQAACQALYDASMSFLNGDMPQSDFLSIVSAFGPLSRLGK